MIAVNRRRYMGAKVEEDLQTFLKKIGCIAYFPLTYDGDTTDILYGLTFDTINSNKFYWDAEKGMYHLDCGTSSPYGATFVVPTGTWSTGYGIMCNCELISGISHIGIINWNNSTSNNWGVIVPEEKNWSATFIRIDNRYHQYRYIGNEINNENTLISGTSSTTLQIGRNKRYASNGSAYLQHLLIFNKDVSFENYLKIKTLIEQTYI